MSNSIDQGYDPEDFDFSDEGVKRFLARRTPAHDEEDLDDQRVPGFNYGADQVGDSGGYNQGYAGATESATLPRHRRTARVIPRVKPLRLPNHSLAELLPPGPGRHRSPSQIERP